MSVRFLAPILAASLFLSGCIDSLAQEEFEETPIEEVSFAATLGIELDDFVPGPSGTWLRDDETGQGEPIAMGQEAGIYYTGWVATGQQFDAVSATDGPPPEFVLGMPGPIDGLTLGLLGMRLGGERTVLVPPSLGFGWTSRTGVPPGSWLVLRLRLVAVDGETGLPPDGPGDNHEGGSGS